MESGSLWQRPTSFVYAAHTPALPTIITAIQKGVICISFVSISFLVKLQLNLELIIRMTGCFWLSSISVFPISLKTCCFLTNSRRAENSFIIIWTLSVQLFSSAKDSKPAGDDCSMRKQLCFGWVWKYNTYCKATKQWALKFQIWKHYFIIWKVRISSCCISYLFSMSFWLYDIYWDIEG